MVVDGINNAGQVVGDFTDAGNRLHGFLRTSAGESIILEFPGPAYRPTGINDAGQIVGWIARIGDVHGFVRSAAGAFTTIDVPGAIGSSHAHGINHRGQIVGSFFKDGKTHGFVTGR